VPARRLNKIGWTNLQIIARHVTPDTCEKLLQLAETHTAKNLEKIMRGEEPILGGRSVLLFFTEEQFATFSQAILMHGSIANGDGFIGKEAALIAALDQNKWRTCSALLQSPLSRDRRSDRRGAAWPCRSFRTEKIRGARPSTAIPA
jgi:hypothetical protein